MMPSGHKETYIEVPLTIERTIFLTDASLLWILLVQSKSLGIMWKSSVSEIAIGFVLYLTVQATTRFMVSIYQGQVLRSISSEVGQAAYLIALLSWIWTIMRRDPVALPLSSDAAARMKQGAGDVAVSKERIFAAVGIKMNKPGEESDQQEPPEDEPPSQTAGVI
jgi:hypothetical protein